jgi:hypothetical protein
MSDISLTTDYTDFTDGGRENYLAKKRKGIDYWLERAGWGRGLSTGEALPKSSPKEREQ